MYAVSYVSGARRDVQGNVVSSDMPSISFKSDRYDPQFGERFEIYG